MATITEISDLDSGVASTDITPERQESLEKDVAQLESQDSMSSAPETEPASTAATNVVETPPPVPEVQSAPEPQPAPEIKPAPEPKPVQPIAAITALADEDDDDDDLDESLAERLVGLAEMFPEGLRAKCSNAVSGSVNLVKGAYNLSRNVVWICVSTSVLLFAPVMFELERVNVEEMMKQDRNRLVLGPGSAMSGPPAPGLMPPPPAR